MYSGVTSRIASAARILAFMSVTAGGGDFSLSWLKPGRSGRSRISSVAPAGTRLWAALSAMRLKEALRRLPARPRILMLGIRANSEPEICDKDILANALCVQR